MNEIKSVTKSDMGLDRTTRWIILIGLAAVVIGAGIGARHLSSSPSSSFRALGHWSSVATCGGLLCAVGGWRAARRWSGAGRHATSRY